MCKTMTNLCVSKESLNFLFILFFGKTKPDNTNEQNKLIIKK